MSRQITPAHTDRKVLDRFWDKVRRDQSGCWVWTASKRNKGYGAFAYTVADKLIQDRAHRFSWVIHNGEIPEGLHVLHRCDNPACVYPVHLFLGTLADNNADMVSKGRHVSGGTHCGERGAWKRGVQHHNARLVPEIIRAIRQDFDSQSFSLKQLASKYGISPGHARKIGLRKLWKHVL